jgi:hypothetical protein
MNIELHNKIIAKITANPECWNQESWHCGTSHCYGGHAQIMSGNPANDTTVRRDARIALDLSGPEADYAFAGSRTLEELKELPEWINRDGYDQYGFNWAGYDQYGFNRDGFNRAGYNRAGYNRAGYDRDGLDKNNKPKQETP